MNNFFDVSLLQQLVITVLGVVIGFPGALIIDRAIRSRSTREQRKELLHTLRGTLGKNLSLVEQLETEPPTEHFTPSYPMDLTILDATADRKYELLPRAAQAVDHARYEITHLDEKLRILREAFLHAQKLPNEQGVIRRSIAEHIGIVKDSISKALKALENERTLRR
jgi:hypothetical protein